MTIVIALLVCGIILILLEVFIPGGVLGVVGVLMVAGGLAMAFIQLGPKTGSILTVAVVVLGGIAFWAWITWFPRSKMGSGIMLPQTADTWRGYDEAKSELIGKRGEARTDLRPAGVVIIDQKRVDVVTRGELIDRGRTVQVVAVEGNRIVVEAASAEAVESASADGAEAAGPAEPDQQA